MGGFEFVVTNGSPQRATAAVRSHAVRSGLSKKNNEKSTASGKESSRLTMFRGSSLRGRFKVNNEPKAETKKRERGEPSRRPEARREASSCAQSESESQAESTMETELAAQPSQSPGLLVATHQETPAPPLVRAPCSPARQEHHISPNRRPSSFISDFLSAMDLNVSSNLITRKYFGFATCDPTVLHSAMGIAALMWSIALPDRKAAYKEGCKQKALTIPSIQERLQANDMSSAVVGAIANLAQMETIEHSYEAARVHLRAIGIIAERKGGYGSFSSEVELATSINWTDLLIAIMTDTKPTIMNLTSNDDVPLSDCVRRQAKQPSVCHLRIFEEAPWDTTVRYTIVQAREALYAIKAKVPNNDMRILSNNLDHRLLTLLHSVPRSSQIYPILLAMQVFGILVIRETELLCAVVETLIPRLIHSLESRLTCQTMPTQEYWCGLAWCLWIGTVSTVPHSENWEWFYQHLSQLIPRIGIVDCVQLKVAMQQFLWDDVRCETTLREYGSALVLQKGNEPTASESMDG